MLAGNPDQVGDGRIEVIDTPQRAARLVAYLRKERPLVGLDTETVGCNPKEVAPARGVGQIVCWSMAVVLPGAKLHSRTGRPLATRIFLWADALEWMRPWLEDLSCPKVWHNGTTYDAHLFHNHGIRVLADWDTLRMSKLINPSPAVQHDLKSLMWWRLGYKLGGFKQLFNRPKRLGTTTLPELAVDKRRGGYRRVVRKVGEHKAVPTVWCPGEVVHRVSWSKTGTEEIPLDTVRTDYPRLVPTLMDYATLDAKATLELQPLLLEKLEGLPWKVGT